jgi:hypothetical protein
VFFRQPFFFIQKTQFLCGDLQEKVFCNPRLLVDDDPLDDLMDPDIPFTHRRFLKSALKTAEVTL